MAESYIFLYAGVYGSMGDAEEDYETIKALHHDKLMGTYDVAIITRDGAGDVKIHKHEMPTRRSAWLGLVAGGVIGIFFPATLIGTVIWAGSGAAFGGVVGHLARGISRGDLKDLGEELDSGEVALVLVAKDRLDSQIDKMLGKSIKHFEKALRVDHKALQGELERAIEEIGAP